MTSVTIPGIATNLGEDAFNNCTTLADLTIPASVAMIMVEEFEVWGVHPIDGVRQLPDIRVTLASIFVG